MFTSLRQPPRLALSIASMVLPLAVVTAACQGAAPENGSPSNDPASWDSQVDTAINWRPVAGTHRKVVPSARLPEEAPTQASNNNVDIILHGGRLYMGWRTSETHFASRDAQMHVVSSGDFGETWEHELTVKIYADVREPRFLSLNGRLWFYYFEAGTNPLAFEPRSIWRTERQSDGAWTEAEVFGNEGEVLWDLKTRNGVAWMSLYGGEHYVSGGVVEVYFRTSTDGIVWTDVGPRTVYRGGVSETAFEFDRDGNMWIIGRNEDCDDTGCGSLLCYAEAGALGVWDCPDTSDPQRYDSPEMFRHGDEIYFVARRDIGGAFGEDGGQLGPYSSRAKTTALYQVDIDARRVVHVFDLPGAGDTAFPSVRQTGAHTFLVANYTSPTDNPDITWIDAQLSPEGTQIYLLELKFEASTP